MYVRTPCVCVCVCVMWFANDAIIVVARVFVKVANTLVCSLTRIILVSSCSPPALLLFPLPCSPGHRQDLRAACRRVRWVRPLRGQTGQQQTAAVRKLQVGAIL